MPLISDWNAAYDNRAAVADPAAYMQAFERDADAYRASARAELDIPYGASPRNRFDLFHPEGAAEGLMMFIHGGYWMRLDKSLFSHMASGAVARGWAAVVPSYDLCPEVTISTIADQIGAALATAAARIEGPIIVSGHSAGGHLAAMMAVADGPAPTGAVSRIARIVAISGVHDLRPLLRTEMNRTLGLNDRTARAASPALARPREGTRITAWVGADELPEMRRQSALIANIWPGLGAGTELVETPDNHFTVIQPLADQDSPLTRAVTSP